MGELRCALPGISCHGRLWQCRTCREWYCQTHWHETSKGRNVECSTCEFRRQMEEELQVAKGERPPREYKWGTPQEWLMAKVGGEWGDNPVELVRVIRELITKLNCDDLADIFPAEMEQDGYYLPTEEGEGEADKT